MGILTQDNLAHQPSGIRLVYDGHSCRGQELLAWLHLLPAGLLVKQSRRTLASASGRHMGQATIECCQLIVLNVNRTNH